MRSVNYERNALWKEDTKVDQYKKTPVVYVMGNAYKIHSVHWQRNAMLEAIYHAKTWSWKAQWLQY